MNQHVSTHQTTVPFSADALRLDAARETERIAAAIREQVL